MIRSLWIAKTGMEAQQSKIDVHANNLANVQTNGFKKARPVFEDLLYQTIRQAGAQSSPETLVPSSTQYGAGTRLIATPKVFTQGNLTQTENNFDLAINGDGFFRIQLPDGSLAYTREGSFQVNAQGEMVNVSGFLLDPNVTLPQNTINLSISRDGIVSATVSDQEIPQELGTIELARFINPAGLQPLGENLFRQTAASGEPINALPGQDGTGLINQGFVETSNVNVVEELIALIEAQRAYEINSKAIQASDQMLARLSQLT